MKTRMLLLTAAFGLCAETEAKTLKITVRNLRTDKGIVLLAANGTDQPLYGRSAPEAGSATFSFEAIETDSLAVSVFHDENGNYRLDMQDGKPTEGCCRRTIALPEADNAVSLELRYDFAASAGTALTTTRKSE